MKKFIIGLFVLGSMGLSSCSDYLNMTPHDKVSDKQIWTNLSTAELATNFIYSYFGDVPGWQCVAGMTEALTDQMKYGNYNYNSLCFIPSEIAYGGSTLTANYVDVYLGYWGTYMTGIRKTNEALSYLKNYGTLSKDDTIRLEAEMRMIRGLLYFEMMKRYKEVIIYDEDMSKITENKSLSTEKEGWDFVYTDLKFAADNLKPAAQTNGRANRGQALALITRAMLYAERWNEVIDAANELEKLYGLEDNYADAFTKTISEGNKEAIIQYLYDRDLEITHDFNYYYTPGGDYALAKLAGGGGYGTPTQEMVESYELAIGGYPDWSKWHKEGVTDKPPYADLEPRFHATILYNGAKWKSRTIESYVGGIDGFCEWRIEDKGEHKGRSTTGYFLRKLVDENFNPATDNGSVQPLTFIRYGEVLLNKAEACYRTNDIAGAKTALNAIRERVDLPAVEKAGEELLKAIKHERKIELAYEGLWYWDLRRWGDAQKDYAEGGLNNYQLHGLRIVKDGTDFIYSYVSVDDKDRNYPAKMNRFPIPSGELSSNKMVNQYPEWK